MISNVIFKFDIQIFLDICPTLVSPYNEYLGGFDSIYIVCENVEIFENFFFFNEQSFVKLSFGILKNILHFDMESSNFI